MLIKMAAKVARQYIDTYIAQISNPNRRATVAAVMAEIGEAFSRSSSKTKRALAGIFPESQK